MYVKRFSRVWVFDDGVEENWIPIERNRNDVDDEDDSKVQMEKHIPKRRLNDEW